MRLSNQPFKLSAPFTFTDAPVASDKLLNGEPKPQLDHRYSDATGQLHTGFWQSEPGSWQVSYQETEICALLEGAVTLTDTSGHSQSFQAPDIFVIPSGFTGTWSTLKPLRKLYVIFEPLRLSGQ